MKVDLSNYKNSVLSLVRSGNDGLSDAVKKIRILDDKVQAMLLWSTIFALWSYLILIFRIFKLYALFKGDHPGLLTAALLITYALFGVIIYVVWKSMKYNGTVCSKVSSTYLNYQLGKLNGQRRLITIYLVAYTALLSVACTFFFFDLDNKLPALLIATLPVSLFGYGLGIYFIIRFSAQKKQLDDLERKIKHVYFMEKIAQN